MTFAIKFDGFMRTLRADASQPHDAKKLCTAMPGTPDYDAWMNLYLNDQGGKLNIMLEDDNYTATWYVFVPRKNEETTEVTDTPTIDEAASDEPVAPKYKVLSTLVDTDTQKLYHVKLSRSHVVRKIAANSKGYLETDHVLVGIASVDKTDANGLFHYEETIITASDEDAKSVEAILYLSARQLSLEEALFSIGEI